MPGIHYRRAAAALTRVGAAVWRGLREVTGETRYDRYAAHHLRAHPERPLPTPREFWRTIAADEERSPSSRCC